MLNKKWLSRFGTILTAMLLLLSFILPMKVEANDIESIQITATIQDNGSVIIRDHRVFHAEEGTEHYISLGSMGDAELLNFTVYDEHGEPLQNIGDWDINASFEETTVVVSFLSVVVVVVLLVNVLVVIIYILLMLIFVL